MRDLSSLGLRVRSGRLTLLDQSLLPSREDWLLCDDVDDLIAHIRALRVRGAPMIAHAAALMVAHRAAAGDERKAVAEAIERLRGSRPTAVNLMHAMDRLRECLAAEDWRHRLATTAEALFEEDRALCEAIADNGAPLVTDGDRVLTHCNTGGLATAGIGTALGILRRAHAGGKGLHVWVGETRPLLQGGRLTAWELGHFGIPYRLIADSAAAALMAAGEVDKVIVGADRIAANGDVANKVGTYSLAVLARHHDIPFYVAAPHTTVDAACPSGADIPIEQRAADELRGAAGPAGRIDWSPADAPVYNPAFDVTPAALISGWVLDTGLLDPADVRRSAFR